MAIRMPLSPGTMFMAPQDLYPTIEALKRGYTPARCFPALCWEAHRSDPNLVLPA